jgi:transposase
MLSEEKIVEVLEAYDLTRSYRSAALLAGVDHHTVRRYVAARDSGLDLSVTTVERRRVSDPFADKISEWIDRSQGRVRADVVHERLGAMGYEGSERTTRRVVSVLKEEWRSDHRRVFKPWIPEPGLWLQWDYGAGPSVAGVRAVLFCAWLAWSRFRVIIPLADKTLPSVISALDRCFRIIGGVPTYALTDNEKTVTDGHVAGIAIRNPQIVAVSYYYGVKVVTCVPADPQSKGGSEATVRIAKADLVPTAANLRDGYDSWDELEEACEAAMAKFNGRPHALTGDKPADRLSREVGLLHAVPVEPYTVAFGETRAVTWSSLIHFRGARYSVPHRFMGQRVWVRVAAGEVIVTAEVDDAASEIARHGLAGNGETVICDDHYPPRRDTPERAPKPSNPDEGAFLEIGEGAARWLIEAAAVGTRQISLRMSEAVALTKLHPRAVIDEALGRAAIAGRFAPGDLGAILAASHIQPVQPPSERSLQNGTSRWAGIGQPTINGDGK